MTSPIASVSLRWRLVALVLASIVAAQGIGFGLLLLFPAPEPPRMSLEQVARALDAPQDQLSEMGLERRVTERAPFAVDRTGFARALALMLATELRRPPETVRVRFPGGAAAGAGPSVTVVQAGQERLDPAAIASLAARAGAGRVSADAASASPLIRTIPLARFEAAVEREGRWVMIRQAEPLLSPWRLRILLAFALSAIILAPLAWWSARRLTRPVRLFAEASERLGADPYAPPLPVAGPAEVRTAAASFNRMQERLRAYVEGRTAMLAAIAHDLRTPLTGLRLRAEAAPEPERSRMAADIARMDAMITQVLAFAHGEQAREVHEALDLAAIGRDCTTDAAELGLHATFEADGPLPVVGEPISLRRAIANLVDNAVRYGGAARVTAAREGGQALILVEDNGPGLPEADLQRVLEPFTRLEPSRSRDTGGVGLGLATAQGVARSHGGTLTLANRAGGGLAARLALPLRS